MAGSQISTAVTIINSLLGFQAISLTNFFTSAESVIAAGSKVEIASGFFNFPSDTQPGATSWTAITTANTAYITCLPSGSAGSQVLTVDYSGTAPLWSDSKQGWYQSAGSLVRYVGGVTKISATQYVDAFILSDEQTATPKRIRYETYEIGDWNMDATAVTYVVVGPKVVNIASLEALIRADADAASGFAVPITYAQTAADNPPGAVFTDPGNDRIQLSRFASETFDSVNYDSTSYNRGWVTVGYFAP